MFIITVCLLKGPINPPENHYAKSPSSFSFFIFHEITKQISKKPITKDNNKLERDKLVTGKDCRNRDLETSEPPAQWGFEREQGWSVTSHCWRWQSPPACDLGTHTLCFMHMQRCPYVHLCKMQIEMWCQSGQTGPTLYTRFYASSAWNNLLNFDIVSYEQAQDHGRSWR